MKPLSVENLEAGFGDVPVLAGVDFSLEPGELVAVLGQSGCGKTTLLRMIAGLAVPTSGRITIEGQVVAEDGRLRVPIEGRGIGLVFQDFALFPNLTVAENVGYGIAGERTRVEALLTRMDLGEHHSRYPHQLSGGQQQRVALARALAPRPKLLLLDEPFANVDANLRLALGAGLRSMLREEARAALLVTHDRQDALGIADRVLVLQRGEAGAVIGQFDTPAGVYRTPATEAVARITGPCAIVPADADGTCLRTPFGELPSTATGSGVVILRPEDMVVGEGATARVRHARYSGDRYTLLLDTDVGPVEAYSDRPRSGSVGITSRSAHFLPR